MWKRWVTAHFEAVFCFVWSILSLRFFQELDSAIAKNRSSPKMQDARSRLPPEDACFCGLAYSLNGMVFASFRRGGSRGRVQGVRQKKTMWFIGVEVEQETSAP